MGHDTARGDYGDRGLSLEFFPKLARMIFNCAQEVCSGKLIIGSHGGAVREICNYVFPKVLQILAGE